MKYKKVSKAIEFIDGCLTVGDIHKAALNEKLDEKFTNHLKKCNFCRADVNRQKNINKLREITKRKSVNTERCQECRNFYSFHLNYKELIRFCEKFKTHTISDSCEPCPDFEESWINKVLKKIWNKKGRKL